MIEITIQTPQVEQRTVSFDLKTIRIGRHPSSDLVLDAEGCSRHHAEVRFAEGSYRIVDLGSTNGIRFGNQAVPELLLFDGVAVSIGVCTLTFVVKEEADSEKTSFLRFDDVPPPSLSRKPPSPAQKETSPAGAAIETPGGAEPTPASETRSPGAPLSSTPSDTPSGTPSSTTSTRPSSAQTLFLLVPRGKKIENFKIVAGAEYTIGRSPNADVVLDDKKSSLEHVEISSRNGRFWVRDLGSSNGTQLGGETVEEAEIGDGDTFIVGETPITLSATRFDLSDEAVLMDQTQRALRISDEDWSEAARSAGKASGAQSSGFERLQGMSAKRTMILVAAGVVVVSAAVVFFVWPDAQPPTEARAGATPETERLRVSVRALEHKSLADVISASCSINPLETATVSSAVGGRMVAMNVSVGSTLVEGTVLARVDPTDIRLQIDEGRSSVSKDQIDVAREDYERKQRLFAERVVTRSVLDRSHNNYLTLDAAYKTSQARIRQLEEQLSKTSIRSPLSGVVVRTFVSAGELIGPGSPVAQIENQSAVLLEAEVSDRDVVRIKLGFPVRARVDAFPGRVFEGAVETISATANPATKSFTVKARVDNTDGSLRSGMNAALDIVLSSRDGLAAPVQALFEVRDGRATVFEVVDGVVRRRSVELGRRVDREMEVLGGLQEGALLVLSGQERLEDGVQVEIYEEGS